MKRREAPPLPGAAAFLARVRALGFVRHHDFYKLAPALSEFDVAGGVERVEGLEALP